MNIPALTHFLNGLSKNNTRPWFAHNKPAYDILRDEFTQLVAELVQQVTKFDLDLGHVDPKKALFRIYRNIRFSSDKSPYKTHFSAVIGEDKMVRPPKGFAADLPHIEAIKHRHFVSGVEINLKKHLSEDLPRQIAALLQDLHPLILWLREALAK